MKNSILHSGRLYDFERQHNYQRHLNKISQITKKRTSSTTLKNDSFLPTYPSGYKIEQEHKVKEQNDRLVKKLTQIRKRKKFEILTPQTEYQNIIKFNSLQKKYRQIQRTRKQTKIQEQNQKLVQKLLDRIKNTKSKEQFSRNQSENFILRKSREKSNVLGSQQKSRLKKSRKVKRNKSGNPNSEFDSAQKLHQERKKNYSTLLPTIQKIYPRSTKIIVDEGQIQMMRDKYNQTQTIQLKSPKKDAHEIDTKVALEVDKKEEEQYEIQFEKDGVILPNQTQEKAEKSQELVKEIQKVQTKGNEAYAENYSKKETTINPQIQKPEVLAKDQSHQNIQKQIPSKVQIKNVMDPTLKFQKLNIKKKSKRRQKIEKIKEQNEYEQEFEELEEEQ